MTDHNRFRTLVQEIANGDPLVLAICSKLGEPSFDDIRLIASELLRCEKENKQLKASLKEASKLLGGLASVCNYAHHGKHDRHSLAEQCPVEKRIDILLEKIKECTL